MFTRKIPLFLTLIILAAALPACSGNTQEKSPETAAYDLSGQVVDGLRVLTINPSDTDQKFTILRGDYVRAQLTTGESFTLKIASLKVDKQFPAPEGEKPYFKVPDAGSFRFSVGEGRGVIQALEFTAIHYREVSPNEGAKFIADNNPVIVDVRTAGEYASGHLENSRLIPVQEFQKRVSELAEFKNDPVFVYCRSGNRSTVAAKIMVDHGFTNVVNLRKGLTDWVRTGLPVVK